MRYLIAYSYVKNVNGNMAIGYGNHECAFAHVPPTLRDVREIEEKLMRMKGFDNICAMNWLELSEDE